MDKFVLLFFIGIGTLQASDQTPEKMQLQHIDAEIAVLEQAFAAGADSIVQLKDLYEQALSQMEHAIHGLRQTKLKRSNCPSKRHVLAPVSGDADFPTEQHLVRQEQAHWKAARRMEQELDCKKREQQVIHLDLQQAWAKRQRLFSNQVPGQEEKNLSPSAVASS